MAEPCEDCGNALEVVLLPSPRQTEAWRVLWLAKDLYLLSPPFACLEDLEGCSRTVLGLSLAALSGFGMHVMVCLTLCFRRLLHLPAREQCPPWLCGSADQSGVQFRRTTLLPLLVSHVRGG